MKVDYLLVGQGIAGSLLSYELLCAGKTVMVIDDGDNHRSSLVAGAVINPMAGKHWTPSADADTFIETAKQTYHQLETLIHSDLLKPADLLVFHESEDAKKTFNVKQKQFPQYFNAGTNGNETNFNAACGSGTISGLYLVDAASLLHQWQKYLSEKGAFRKERFRQSSLHVDGSKVSYEDIQASMVIFCEGASAAENPFFEKLPFTQNRGEALLLHIPGLPQNNIYHRELRLVPKGDELFWCGSNYKWNFEDLAPDEDWKQQAISELQSWLKLPFSVKEHIVARRPTTAGQIPLIGIHPKHNAVAVFNGLGTRGFSAGPHWAKAFAALLCGIKENVPDYDQARFQSFF